MFKLELALRIQINIILHKVLLVNSKRYWYDIQYSAYQCDPMCKESNRYVCLSPISRSLSVFFRAELGGRTTLSKNE